MGRREGKRNLQGEGPFPPVPVLHIDFDTAGRQADNVQLCDSSGCLDMLHRAQGYSISACVVGLVDAHTGDTMMRILFWFKRIRVGTYPHAVDGLSPESSKLSNNTLKTTTPYPVVSRCTSSVPCNYIRSMRETQDENPANVGTIAAVACQ